MSETVRISIARRFVPLVFSLAITSTCLFASAGRLDWPNAWVLLGLNFVASVLAMVLLWRNPELAAERSNIKEGKSWDKPLVALSVLVGPVATWVTAGLEKRFHPADEMQTAQLLAGVAIGVLAAVLISWAMYTNRFFSSVVRIQKDRGHVVISGGPYGFVRHPGYTGIATITLVTPLILNSRWAFIPAVLSVAVTVLRTSMEDRTLQSELAGYADYARRVKYRLLPMVW